MENITTDLVVKADLNDTLLKWFRSLYKINSQPALDKIINNVSNFTDYLKDDLKFLIEYPYVDKLYRDTYYNYYSSKTISYSRDCIRLSIFQEGITKEDQLSSAILKTNYLGFLVLRPTFPKVIGRNIISPYAFKENDLHICNLNVPTTANFSKLTANGFPHSTQDTETITCAETTLWSIVEYFSNRYNYYSPLLPSEIHAILSQFAFERQIPSKGLQAAQISFALKKIGFGVRIYNRNAFTSEFDSYLRTYIESGIPVVGVIQNHRIGHALNIIGRTSFDEDSYSSLPKEKLRLDLEIKDISNCKTKLVFVDDNYPPYRTAEVNTPTSYYSSANWEGCIITSFIVPLYPKIYMEAGEARKISKDLLRLLGVYKNRGIAIKTYLTSSRSYKDYLLNLSNIDSSVKNILLSLSMPKFIWVTEIFDEGEFLNNKCEGLILLDATEPNEFHIIGSIFENTFLKKDNNSGYKTLQISKSTFQSFNNLRYYGDN